MTETQLRCRTSGQCDFECRAEQSIKAHFFSPRRNNVRRQLCAAIEVNGTTIHKQHIQSHSVDSFFNIGASAIAYCENNDCVELKKTTKKKKRTKKKRKKKTNKILLNSKVENIKVHEIETIRILRAKQLQQTVRRIFSNECGIFSVHLFQFFFRQNVLFCWCSFVSLPSFILHFVCAVLNAFCSVVRFSLHNQCCAYLTIYFIFFSFDFIFGTANLLLLLLSIGYCGNCDRKEILH